MKTAQKSKKRHFEQMQVLMRKLTTARIATARQKNLKMSTARIIKN
jgi:hypothetical protein